MLGRPQESEAAPYYFTYINQVVGDDVTGTLTRQVEEARTFFDAISEEASLRRYAAGKWSIRQVLNHLSDTERALAFRALWFARGFDAPLPSYDQNVAAAGADADTIPWDAHRGEFHSVRLSTIALFKNMPAEAWTRTGIASEKHFSVRAVAYIIAGHLTHHIQILRTRYL